MSALTIEHTAATGTLLSGTSRGDGASAAARALGWRWGRSAGAWFVPRSRGTAPPRELIARTRDALAAAGFTVQVRIDDTVPDSHARWDRIATYEAARAAALVRRADRHQQLADEHAAAFASLAALIPPGQPLLVDSAGYASHLRLRARMDRHERDQRRHDQAAQQLRAAAHRAEHGHASRHSPVAVTNRVAALERDLRRIRARITATPTSGDEASTMRLIDREQVLASELAYWQAVHAEQLAAAEVVDYGPEQVHVGDQVQIGARWWTVVRANKASVTVLMDPATSRTDRTPWRNVRAARPAPAIE
jgi:hypothetical protein